MKQVDKIKEFQEENSKELRAKMLPKFFDYCLDYWGTTREKCRMKSRRKPLNLPELQALASLYELAQVYMYSAEEIAEEIGWNYSNMSHLRKLVYEHRSLSKVYRDRVKNIIGHFDNAFI